MIAMTSATSDKGTADKIKDVQRVGLLSLGSGIIVGQFGSLCLPYVVAVQPNRAIARPG
jgi:hypothetical protein